MRKAVIVICVTVTMASGKRQNRTWNGKVNGIKSESRAAECVGGNGVTASEISAFGQRSEGKRSSFSCSPWGTGARSMIMFGGGTVSPARGYFLLQNIVS